LWDEHLFRLIEFNLEDSGSSFDHQPPSNQAAKPLPAEPTAKKKELLFSDDFERAELGKDKNWAIVVPTFSLENGTWTLSALRRQFTFPEAA
jgi:hypothetical protein